MTTSEYFFNLNRIRSHQMSIVGYEFRDLVDRDIDSFRISIVEKFWHHIIPDYFGGNFVSY